MKNTKENDKRTILTQEQLQQLCKDNPNDMILGEKLRELNYK